MPRRLLFWLAVAALAACAHQANKPSLQVRPFGQQHRVLVFGDSLALGTGASDSGRGFTFLLYRELLRKDPSAQITSFAAAGARVNDVLRYELTRAHGQRATDVWICVGGNDVTRSTQRERFASEESAVVRAARRGWPAAKIVVFGVPDVSKSPLFMGEARRELRRLADSDNRAARHAAAENHATFVDLFALGKQVDPRRDFSADDFHPNDRGYDAITKVSQSTVIGKNEPLLGH